MLRKINHRRHKTRVDFSAVAAGRKINARSASAYVSGMPVELHLETDVCNESTRHELAVV